MANKRIHVIYSGRVQGIGFRYTAEAEATHLKLRGWVKNLPDGTVELLCEGTEAKLNELLKKIQTAMTRYIIDTDLSWEDATGEFEDFQIRFW